MDPEELIMKYKSHLSHSSSEESANEDFDVEDYVYEPEQYVTSKTSLSSAVIPEPIKKYYLPLTDVPHPDDVDSTYDMKKFLRGDYCLESDIQQQHGKSLLTILKMQSFSSELFPFEAKLNDDYSSFMETEELRQYMKGNLDRVSFAGDIIMGISRGYATINIFENVNKSEIVNLADEELRRLRLIDAQVRENQRKVYISEPDLEVDRRPIKRRQTGFTHPEQFEELLHVRDSFVKVSDSLKLPIKFHIKSTSHLGVNANVTMSDETTTAQGQRKIIRRPTTFISGVPVNDDNDVGDDYYTQDTRLAGSVPDLINVKEESRIVRIDSAKLNSPPCLPIARRLTSFSKEFLGIEETNAEKEYLSRRDTYRSVVDEAPTLKDYRPQNELHIADLFVKDQTGQRPGKLHRDSQPLKGEYQYLRPSLTVEDVPETIVKKKTSPSKDLSMIALRRPQTNSFRSYEYAKQRPTMTVSEYKMKNLLELLAKPRNDVSDKGIRLPGDTPLYSPAGSLIGHSSPPTKSPLRKSLQKISNTLLPVLSEEIPVVRTLDTDECVVPL
ncbi:uncharacterized protein LOC113235925 [Hyposmocoma kahamanoa]|uniref:uncharacterized protein LOC113235925 n=1 Tax=Hyposmocoma kahamanoa TaxID=1477025 RepID=UPI000E6D79FB|nr:uncharacterized protein LOC113235925 [Hyposmocoma kahamanoa]